MIAKNAKNTLGRVFIKQDSAHNAAKEIVGFVGLNLSNSTSITKLATVAEQTKVKKHWKKNLLKKWGLCD